MNLIVSLRYSDDQYRWDIFTEPAKLLANPKATKTKPGRVFENALKVSLAVFGSSFTKTVPFFIRSPAPFLTSLLGAKTDC